MPDMISRQQAEALIQEQLINTIQQDTPKTRSSCSWHVGCQI